MRWQYLGCAAICLLLAAPVVRAQEADAASVAQLRAELADLSAIVADLAGQLTSGQGSSGQPAFSGNALEQLDQVRAELARLTGQSEQLEFRIRQVVADASNRIGDIEFRLTELEGGDVSALGQSQPLGAFALPSEGSTSLSMPDTGTQPPTTETPELAAGEQAAFAQARQRFEEGRYDEAAEQLAQFVEFYPGGPLSSEAALLLGETQSRRGNDTAAARAYLDLYMANPDGARAPQALLRLGASLAALGQISEACVMYEELGERFAGSPEAAEAGSALTMLSCQ